MPLIIGCKQDSSEEKGDIWNPFLLSEELRRSHLFGPESSSWEQGQPSYLDFFQCPQKKSNFILQHLQTEAITSLHFCNKTLKEAPITLFYHTLGFTRAGGGKGVNPYNQNIS